MPPLIPSTTHATHRPIRALLDDNIRRKLRAYCRYSQASSDEVIHGSLARLFEADSDFGPWERANPEEPPLPAKKKPEAKPQAGAQPTATVARN